MIRWRASSISTPSGSALRRASIRAAHSDSLIVSVPAWTKCDPDPARTLAVICGSLPLRLSYLPMTVKWKRAGMAEPPGDMVALVSSTRAGARGNALGLTPVRRRPFHLPLGLALDDGLALLEPLLAAPH